VPRGRSPVIAPALGLAAVGAALAWVGYAWVPHLVTPLCVRRGPRHAGRRIALTFDDGPDPEYTPRVLEILAAHDVRASFFLVGERAARAPQTVRAIADAGHEIGSHGWSHRSLWLCGPARTNAEIGRARVLLGGLTGTAPRLFRPPWGMVNAAMFAALRRHEQRCIFWSIQPEGLRPASAATQVERVLRRAHPGAIVDLHDAEGTPRAPARLCAALPAMIDGLTAAGYRFGTVGELLAS
jgi:peptidoglycan-N-acetylglucosamine deacetylase